jgi:hypothetical protein
MSLKPKPKAKTDELVISTLKPEKQTKKKPRSVDSAKKRIKKREEYIAQHEHVIDEIQVRTEEQEYMQEYAYLYRRMKKLVRKAERQALKSGQSRDYYAFCTLVSQQREIIADIRAATDFSNQVQQIIDNMLQPLISQIGQAVVDNSYHQRRLLVEVCSAKDKQFVENELDRMTRDFGTLLQNKYEWAAKRTDDLLIGEHINQSPKKK